MKLDLPAIHKLAPPGLYALADLRAFVLVLVRVIELGIGISGAGDAKSYAHMLARHTKELRTKTSVNLNLKLKAWVLACPERIIHARTVIGEAAIRNWVARLRAAYMSPNLMADQRQKELGRDRQRKYKRRSYRPRTGKPFALVRLAEVEKLLPFRPRWPRNIRRLASVDTGNVRHAVRLENHLANLGHSDKTQQSRPPHPQRPRPQKPIRFFPSELGVKIRDPETKKGMQKHGENPPAKLAKANKPDPNGSGKQDTGPDNPRPEKPP